MSRSVIGERAVRTGSAGARRGERRDDAADHRPRESPERPQRRDADCAGADEAHLMAEDVVGQRRGIRDRRVHRRQHRNEHGPRDHDPREHRDADRESDQVPDSDEREREADVESRYRRRAGAQDSGSDRSRTAEVPTIAANAALATALTTTR